MLVAFAVRAEPVRLATWHGDFSRKGPGLLFRDLTEDKVDLSVIVQAAPDVLVLTDIDYDAGQAALGAMQAGLAEAGINLPFVVAERPNSGWQTGLDLDGDGRAGGPRDAQGYGRFAGDGGMAVLSRYPLTLERDFSTLLWAELPGSGMAAGDAAPDLQRLSSVAHWSVKVALPEGDVTLLTLSATPPVFDGPEDRNGRRNRDELRLWTLYLDGALGPPPTGPVVLMGNLNLDPARGNGLRDTVAEVLSHPRLQDPMPGQATVTWDSTGPMRVSYVLPDRALGVAGAGLIAPGPADGPHALVWVDVVPPPSTGPSPDAAPRPAVSH